MALDYLSKYKWKKSFLPELENSLFIKSEDLQNMLLHKVNNENYEPVICTIPYQNCNKVPGQNLKCLSKMKSSFNNIEHDCFIKAGKIINSGKQRLSYKEKQIVATYNNSKIEILEENQKFLKEAEKHWNNYSQKQLKCNPTLLKAAMERRFFKIQKILKLPRYFKEIDSLSLSHCDSDIPVTISHDLNLLDIGKVSKFHPPIPNEAFHATTRAIAPPENKIHYSQMPVSQDKNIDGLLQNNNIQLVISMSALKKIIDFTDTNQTWFIPVVVKAIQKKDGNGQIFNQNVIFIDKVLPKLNTNNIELNEKIHKYLFKSNFCHIEAFSYPNKGVEIELNECSQNKTNDCDMDVDEDSNDNMNIDEVNNVKVEKNVNKSEKNKTQILDGVENVKLLSNASYKLWTIQQVDESATLMKKHTRNYSYKILIRSKIDACELIENAYLQPLLVTPKLEYQPSYGGSTSSKSELINQWTSLYFNPRSILYRVRCHHSSLEVFMIEHCTIQKVSNEMQTMYEHKPQLGLGVLYKICYGLTNCSPGNYLLGHVPKNGPFVNLLQEVSENVPGSFDLHELYTSHSSIEESYKKPWCPIDVNVQLPHYTFYGQKCGLFTPTVAAKKTYKFKSLGVKKRKKRKGVTKNKLE